MKSKSALPPHLRTYVETNAREHAQSSLRGLIGSRWHMGWAICRAVRQVGVLEELLAQFGVEVPRPIAFRRHKIEPSELVGKGWDETPEAHRIARLHWRHKRELLPQLVDYFVYAIRCIDRSQSDSETARSGSGDLTYPRMHITSEYGVALS